MKIRVGIIGLGTVGTGTLELLDSRKTFISKELGLDFDVVALCARTPGTLDRIGYPNATKTRNPLDVCAHPEIDVILELAGGSKMPLQWITSALQNRKHVITANKALLAEHGGELFALAKANGCFLLYEAAVGGGVPVIRTLHDSLVPNEFEEIACIINGTCNFILTEMQEDRTDYPRALARAQELGLAEANPAMDVEGTDSAHKLAILASLAHGKWLDYRQMGCEGILGLTRLDMEMAANLGHNIKLLGVARKVASGITAAVYPALVHRDHPLAPIKNATNAVFFKTSASGELLLTGPGAGKLPTASAVTADLIHIGQNLRVGNAVHSTRDFFHPGNPMDLVPLGEQSFAFYLRITAADEPGAMAQITRILAEYNISINYLLQRSTEEHSWVPVILVTHETADNQVTKAVAAIDALDIVRPPSLKLRFFS